MTCPLPPDYRVEHLIEALEECRGFITQTRRYMKKKWGYDIGTKTIKSKIQMEGLDEWLDDIRKSLVEDCMKKTFLKGIQDGDNHCLFWVLNHYKQHIDFLEPREENKPERVSGEIEGFMDLLWNYNANSSTQQQAAPSISAEQRKD